MFLLNTHRMAAVFRPTVNGVPDFDAVVTVRLLGGLGNQMFQYATGRSLAIRLGAELLLDVSAFECDELRKYELANFRISARICNLEEFMRGGVKDGVFGRWASKVRGRRRWRTVVFKEPSFTYDPEFARLSAPVYLDGYWQSERYFADQAGLLRDEFVLKSPIDSRNERVIASIELAGAASVSLHVRRGDYVSNPQTAQYHGVCSLDYYVAAIKYISSRVSDPVFFVFSDDLEWVRANLQTDHTVMFVDVNDASQGAWDMELMRKCRHHVIANSSFSWWGAWLNPHPDKIVIAPRRWFSGASHDTRDLIPASWVRL